MATDDDANLLFSPSTRSTRSTYFDWSGPDTRQYYEASDYFLDSLTVMNSIFTMLFLFECLLKIAAFGVKVPVFAITPNNHLKNLWELVSSFISGYLCRISSFLSVLPPVSMTTLWCLPTPQPFFLPLSSLISLRLDFDMSTTGLYSRHLHYSRRHDRRNMFLQFTADHCLTTLAKSSKKSFQFFKINKNENNSQHFFRLTLLPSRNNVTLPVAVSNSFLSISHLLLRRYCCKKRIFSKTAGTFSTLSPWWAASSTPSSSNLG